MSYCLLDSGDQQKLEKFGDYTLVRPCSAALWKPIRGSALWKSADASFTREEESGWSMRTQLPSSWVVELHGLLFKIIPTDFGHLGLFPEHSALWSFAEELIKQRQETVNVLNLFAYSGGATLALARAGAKVCHLDASKSAVDWARENATLNHLEGAPIRWIVEDVLKFLQREIKRGRFYDGIILDPPSFGRGNRGEVFKIERDLEEILAACRALLSERALFVILTTHTPGMTPTTLRHIIDQMMRGAKGKIECGEMLLSSPNALEIPSGSFARWMR